MNERESPETPLAPAEAPCLSSFDAEVERNLAILGDRRPERSGMAEVVYPASPDEATRLNRMAIVAVRVFARQREALPFGKILIGRVGSKGALLALRPVFPVSRVKEIRDPASWRERLGPYVQTAYFLAPIRELLKEGELHAELALPGESIRLLKLPAPVDTTRFAQGDPRLDREDPERLPEPSTVFRILRQRFCVGG